MSRSKALSAVTIFGLYNMSESLPVNQVRIFRFLCHVQKNSRECSYKFCIYAVSENIAVNALTMRISSQRHTIYEYICADKSLRYNIGRKQNLHMVRSIFSS